MFHVTIHCTCGSPDCEGHGVRILDAEGLAHLIHRFISSRHPAAEDAVSVAEDTGTLTLRADNGDYIVAEPLPEWFSATPEVIH